MSTVQVWGCRTKLGSLDQTCGGAEVCSTVSCSMQDSEHGTCSRRGQHGADAPMAQRPVAQCRQWAVPPRLAWADKTEPEQRKVWVAGNTPGSWHGPEVRALQSRGGTLSTEQCRAVAAAHPWCRTIPVHQHANKHR